MTGKERPWHRVEFWSCIGLVLFFFLPWVSLGGLINLTGYQVGDMMRQASSARPTLYHINNSPLQNAMRENSQTIGAVIIYLIPIVAAICAIIDLTNAKKRPILLYVLAGALPFVALFFALSDSGTDLFRVLSIGAWLTLIAAIGSIVGTFTGK